MAGGMPLSKKGRRGILTCFGHFKEVPSGFRSVIQSKMGGTAMPLYPTVDPPLFFCIHTAKCYFKFPTQNAGVVIPEL